MNTAAITLKAMESTPAKEFGNIARMQYGISKSDKEKKSDASDKQRYRQKYPGYVFGGMLTET